MVEQWNHNPKVIGSSPIIATINTRIIMNKLEADLYYLQQYISTLALLVEKLYRNKNTPYIDYNCNFIIGVITKNRYNSLTVLLKSLKSYINNTIIVDVSDNINYNILQQYNYLKLFIPKNNTAVVFNKNRLIEYFLNQTNKPYLFLIEDDIKILDIDVFNLYIKILEKYNLPYLNFGGKNDDRMKYNINDDITVHENLQGNFTLYSRECLNSVGIMNEQLCHNCWEHVEHIARIHMKYNYDPVFWHFPDIKNSYEYIKEQEIESIINKDNNHSDWIQKDKSILLRLLGWSNLPNISSKRLNIEVINKCKR